MTFSKILVLFLVVLASFSTSCCTATNAHDVLLGHTDLGKIPPRIRWNCMAKCTATFRVAQCKAFCTEKLHFDRGDCETHDGVSQCCCNFNKLN
ncbi:hypothetical protein OROGR_018105 [Orobanche gracilis]